MANSTVSLPKCEREYLDNVDLQFNLIFKKEIKILGKVVGYTDYVGTLWFKELGIAALPSDLVKRVLIFKKNMMCNLFIDIPSGRDYIEYSIKMKVDMSAGKIILKFKDGCTNKSENHTYDITKNLFNIILNN